MLVRVGISRKNETTFYTFSIDMTLLHWIVLAVRRWASVPIQEVIGDKRQTPSELGVECGSNPITAFLAEMFSVRAATSSSFHSVSSRV